MRSGAEEVSFVTGRIAFSGGPWMAIEIDDGFKRGMISDYSTLMG